MGWYWGRDGWGERGTWWRVQGGDGLKVAGAQERPGLELRWSRHEG